MIVDFHTDIDFKLGKLRVGGRGMFSEGERRLGEDRPRLEAGTGTPWSQHQQHNNTFRFLINNLCTPICCLLVAKCCFRFCSKIHVVNVKYM